MALITALTPLWLLLSNSVLIQSQITTPLAGMNTTTPDPNQTTILVTSSMTLTSTEGPALSSVNLPATLIEPNTDLAECTCDRTQYACDVNCCCDNECTAVDRVVFSKCSDQLTSAEQVSNLCTYDVKLFKDYNVSTKTINNPFFFCIWREVSVSRNYYTPVDLVKTKDSFEIHRSRYGGYAYQYQYEVPEIAGTTDANYRSGGLLVTWRRSMPGVFYVPSSVGPTSSCVDRNPVKFLEDASSSCMRNLDRPLSVVCGSERTLSSYYLAQDLEDVFLKKRPDVNTAAADRISVNVTGETQTVSWDASTGMCVGVMKEVVYTITHEAGVLTSAKAFVTLADVSGDVTAVEQKHVLKFVDHNSNSDAFRRSGNPGYLIGEPVLVGKRVNDYIALNGDRMNYLSMITSSANGDCFTDGLLRKPILFGENFRSGCLWKLQSDYKFDDSKCNDIRTHIVEALLGPTRSIDEDEPFYIATFGNSNPLKVGDWVRVLVSDQLSTQDCFGVSLHLEILYANVGALNNPQAMIIGAELVLKPINIEFLCVGAYCQSQNVASSQNIEMVTSVAFVDVTQASERAIAEKPVASSKLPANFFHPYYISSGCSSGHFTPYYYLYGLTIWSLAKAFFIH